MWQKLGIFLILAAFLNLAQGSSRADLTKLSDKFELSDKSTRDKRCKCILIFKSGHKTVPTLIAHFSVFSLFSIVTFKNDGCASSSGSSTTRNGTCYTATECSNKGGTASGNCASG